MISKKIHLKLFIIKKINRTRFMLLHFFNFKFSNNFVALALENCLKFSTFEWNIRQICFAF